MAARASSIDVRLRLKGQRQFSREAKTAGADLEAMGLKGAAALGSFAAKRDKFKEFGRNWSRSVTLPILTAGGVAAKMAVDWEDAFAGVRKTVDATEKQYAALDVGLRNMSMRIPVAATELAAIAEAAGQLGIKRQAILGFTRTVADLGVATNLAGEEGASSLAKFANITQMPQSQFDRLGSTIVALGNAGASTEKDIVAMGLRLAGAGSFVGMSEAQILGFSNALSSVGIEAEMGGTAFSRVFKTLNSAVSAGGRELADFAAVAGISGGKFAKAWKQDAATATASWIEGLGRLKKEGKDVPAILSELNTGLRGERVQDALLRASNAGKDFRESLDLGVKSWRQNNALTDEARKRYKTLKSQLKILKNIAVNFAVVIGRHLVPAIRSFAQWIGPKIKSAAKWFGGLSKPMKTAVVGAAALLAVVGPLVWVLGSIAGGIGKILILANAWQKMGGIAGLFGESGKLAFVTNPVFLAIAAIAALAVGFYIAYKKVGWFRDAVDTAFGALKEAFSWIKTKGGPGIEWLVTALGDVVNFVKGNWQAILILLTGPVGVGVVTVVTHFEKIKTAIGAMVDFAKTAIPDVINFLRSAWESRVFQILSWPIRTYIKFQVKLWMAVKDVLVKAFGIIKSVWPAVSKFLKDPIGNAVNFIKSAFNSVIGFFSSLPGRIGAAASGMWNGIMVAFKAAINWVIDKWNGLQFSIGGWNIPTPGPIPDIKIPKLTVGMPDIPRLAMGGNVRAAGMVEVGERGPEILQLPRAARVTPLDPNPIDPQRGRFEITLNNKTYLDGREVASNVARHADDAAAYA